MRFFSATGFRCVGKFVVRLAGCLPLVVGFAGVAHADVIFSNLSSPPSNMGYGISAAFTESVGQDFTPSANYTMTSATVQVFSLGSDSAFNMYLYANSNGVPGSAIATLATDLTAPYPPANDTVVTGPIALSANTEYWLVLTAYDKNSLAAWDYSASGNSDTAFYSPNTGWQNQGSINPAEFEIDGTLATAATVPEPGSFALLFSGLGGMAVLLRRKRLGAQ